MYTEYLYNNYLAHHGVKGQQWGVRNGPPYPIEDKVLKKGTKINSVSSKYISGDDYRNQGDWVYTYRDDEKWDKAVYKGAFSKYLIMYRGAEFIKEHKFETVRDLTMPNKNERVSEFKDLLNDPKYNKTVKNDLEEIRNMLVKQQIGNEAEQEAYKNFNVNNIKTSEDYKTAYSIFNHAMEFKNSRESTKEYARRMAEKYDAMVDDNNQGTYNNAHDPIIIFKANEVLKTLNEEFNYDDFLSSKDVIENYDYIKEELAKEGKRVKL